eukprot:scaffold40574_cov27-Tisochrysis_lutea.AAC.24
MHQGGEDSRSPDAGSRSPRCRPRSQGSTRSERLAPARLPLGTAFGHVWSSSATRPSCSSTRRRPTFRRGQGWGSRTGGISRPATPAQAEPLAPGRAAGADPFVRQAPSPMQKSHHTTYRGHLHVEWLPSQGVCGQLRQRHCSPVQATQSRRQYVRRARHRQVGRCLGHGPWLLLRPAASEGWRQPFRCAVLGASLSLSLPEPRWCGVCVHLSHSAQTECVRPPRAAGDGREWKGGGREGEGEGESERREGGQESERREGGRARGSRSRGLADPADAGRVGHSPAEKKREGGNKRQRRIQELIERREKREGGDQE